MNANKLLVKVAVFTGASKGIGTAISKHLAAAGASVVANYAYSADLEYGCTMVNKSRQSAKEPQVHAVNEKPLPTGCAVDW